MKGEHDRGRTDPCAKHIDGRTEPVRTGIPFTQGCFVQNLVDKGPVFRNYLPLEKGGALHLNKRESPSPKDALCQLFG